MCIRDRWYLAQKEIQVKYSEVNGEWRITGKNADSPRNAFAYATYGTERANAYKILEDTLNLKDVRIYDKSVNENGDEIRVLNKKETMLASQKQDAMKVAFKDWIFKDQQRRERLVKVYNERFNSIRPREYDGSHLTFPGMNPEIEIRPHQKNAVAHQLYGENVLLAHVVGAGKTYEMVAAAMESKRLGLSQKNLFVVPEAALSYAEVKALATGNPAVKEKMALDVDVAKLKLLKANHMNNQYRLEDDIARNFPQQIAKLTEIIDSYKADIAHFSEYKITDPEQFSMEISGKVFTEKKEAGAALLAVCKEIKSVDAAMDIGSYQGFNMRIQFDSWSKEFILSVKHESVAKVRLGADALGNITRINNLLESYPEKLAEAEQRLETVQEQMTNAKEEVGKPFPKEEELNQKLERLSELNALLNMDEREDTEAEQSESKEKEERPARGSIHEKLQIYKEKSQRESENGREDRKRDFGLE